MVKILNDDEGSAGPETNPTGWLVCQRFTVGHNAFELLLDCYQTYAEDTAAILHTRIITPPA